MPGHMRRNSGYAVSRVGFVLSTYDFGNLLSYVIPTSWVTISVVLALPFRVTFSRPLPNDRLAGQSETLIGQFY